jgi:adenylosuccinate synthase
MSTIHALGDIHVVVGGQFGSEAKGHVAAQIHQTRKVHNAVRIGGPNAGHSAVDATGRVWALRTIPVAAVVDAECRLIIGAGSEIDPIVLEHEITMLEEAGFSVRDRLLIDYTATILDPSHIETETARNMHANIGSTGKGIGAARADRIMRTARIADELYECEDTAWFLQDQHLRGQHTLIEGTQGYGLGLHAGFYPHCTSGDCRAIDCIAQAGITPLQQPDIWLVFRTYPIRVAGNSGDMHNETNWEELNEISGGYIQAERTTVTKKIRRVASWDFSLAQQAIHANGTAAYDSLHSSLMFVDYLDPSLAGCTDYDTLRHSPAFKWISRQEQDLGIKFKVFGTSDRTVVWANQ